ncbi:DUF692 family protein [Burkholderia sp. MS455]|uniref:multinuclear nonheme iron-dependent oxidase n=1 Tax=Burkholderia sp. MS455 TaxID=2811788 RepID=UPI00195CFBB2|nr:DUF692 family multinuclear iron-containing protein [Burkholderia sp. MS455]QRR07701.1 DUF692 family protein [Burkholderia sp. MS455]
MQAIGLGLDFQHRHGYGQPLAPLLESLTSRLSHLSIVGLLTYSEARQFRGMTSLPLVHHFTGVAPAGAVGINLDALHAQCAISDTLDAVWCLEDIGIWNIGPYHIPYFAPPVLCQAVLDQTVSGIATIQHESAIPFLAGLPSCSFVAGDLTLDAFFNQLTDRTGCGIVLDVSHVFSYARYCAREPFDLLNALPLEHAVEIRVAGGSIHPQYAWRYRDTHSEPIAAPVLALLDTAIGRCPNLRAITYEIGSGIAPELVSEEITRLQEIANRHRFVPRVTTDN